MLRSMNTDTGPRAGIEWGGDPGGGGDWPDLRPADLCDGRNPMTQLHCALGCHKGYHRDVTGAEWLDDE